MSSYISADLSSHMEIANHDLPGIPWSVDDQTPPHIPLGSPRNTLDAPPLHIDPDSDYLQQQIETTPDSLAGLESQTLR